MVGVDLAPQPHYPFPFVQADALEYLDAADLSGYAAIHASPPCKGYTALKSTSRLTHPLLVGSTRDRLRAWGGPYVIENVPGAPMPGALVLCGSEFGLHAQGRWLRRHRLFESNVDLWGAGGCGCAGRRIGGVYGGGSTRPSPDGRRSGWSFAAAGAAQVMGIDWMNRDELAQAIPPAYTEHIGRALLLSYLASGVVA